VEINPRQSFGQAGNADAFPIQSPVSALPTQVWIVAEVWPGLPGFGRRRRRCISIQLFDLVDRHLLRLAMDCQFKAIHDGPPEICQWSTP
jgi:hypothetical protein